MTLPKEWIGLVNRIIAGEEMAHPIERHLVQALALCPVGSRIAMNIEPGIMVYCKKEQESGTLTVKWLITDRAK